MDRKTTLSWVGLVVVAALSRRLRRLVLWPAGDIDRRAFVVYVAATTLFNFAVRQWLQPYAQRQERERHELEQRLGREITPGEFGAMRLAARRAT